MPDVQGVGSHPQRGLQAVEGLSGVVVEGRVGGTVTQHAEQTAGNHVAGNQVTLIE